MNLVINLKLYRPVDLSFKAKKSWKPGMGHSEVSKAQLSMQNRLPFQWSCKNIVRDRNKKEDNPEGNVYKRSKLRWFWRRVQLALKFCIVMLPM
jgi:hypothetical protein